MEAIDAPRVADLLKSHRAIALVGPNASGKTRLAEQLRRQLASDRVRYIAFCDSYGPVTDRSYYLQQRWNQHDIEAEMPLTGQLLERSFLLTGPDNPQRRDMQQRLYQQLGMDTLLDSYIISLSSGELRKFQLVKTLMAEPEILILDNPFIGLDAPMRQQLRDLLQQLVGVKLVLLLARPDEVPPFADCIVTLQYHPTTLAATSQFSPLVSHTPAPDSSREAVCLNDVTIRYGSRTILSHVSWTIHEGEHWALSGRNGSGKSTLLSLICADNPQSYACDISLFGRRRGTGESIWDIKRRIGYVSPEMHRSYQRNLPALHVVASGLKDTVGLYVRPNQAERQQCLAWMRVFGVESLADRPFLQLSSGEQRLLLVARAFVKSPSLLILDEPLHGLDTRNSRLVKDVIDAYCRQPAVTLIMVTHYQEELPPCIDHSLCL